MPSFYFIAIGIAVVVLILCLTLVGLLMSYQDDSVSYPPTANVCPDNWTPNVSNKNNGVSTCNLPTPTSRNVGTIFSSSEKDNGSYFTAATYGLYNIAGKAYKPTPETATAGFAVDARQPGNVNIDFTNPQWGGICGKKKWAQMYNISWDGVSNYNSCTKM